MSSKIRVEYRFYGKDDTRCLSRGFDDLGLAAEFMRNLYATRYESLTLLVEGKEFGWPKDTSSEEVLIKHLEYCMDMIEAFYNV